MSAEPALRAALDGASSATSPAAALHLLDAALANDARLDDAAVLHHARANVLMALERIDDAVLAADRAVGLAPAVPDFASNLGAALLARFRLCGDDDDLQRAARVLVDAVILGPRTPQLRATLAVTLSQQGRYDDALAVCDDNLVQFPDDAATLFNRAAALLGAGRRDEARATLTTLATTFPPAQAALLRLG